MGVSSSIILYLKQIYINLINYIELLLDQIFYYIYDKTPKQVGDIDEDLIDDINEGVEYLIIRFKTFNTSPMRIPHRQIRILRTKFFG